MVKYVLECPSPTDSRTLKLQGDSYSPRAQSWTCQKLARVTQVSGRLRTGLRTGPEPGWAGPVYICARRQHPNLRRGAPRPAAFADRSSQRPQKQHRRLPRSRPIKLPKVRRTPLRVRLCSRSWTATPTRPSPSCCNPATTPWPRVTRCTHGRSRPRRAATRDCTRSWFRSCQRRPLRACGPPRGSRRRARLPRPPLRWAAAGVAALAAPVAAVAAHAPPRAVHRWSAS